MKRIFVTLIIISIIPFLGVAQELRSFRDLEGDWQFTVGDNLQWAEENYNDYSWDNIYAPKNWESQGYEGYNGYAWYRKTFKLGEIDKTLPVILKLGRIDDVDEVFLNGKKLGQTGNFFPNYQSAFDTERSYLIPTWMLRTNSDNVIAIRVYDSYYVGGIVSGPLGLYYDITKRLLEIDLSGTWRFAKSIPGDNINPKINELKWTNISVPGYWESQGFEDFDGYGIYYKKFQIPSRLKNEDLYLVLGKIDDYDYVYFNGKLIGKVFDLKDEGAYSGQGNEYTALRAYKIPDNLIKYDEENTVIVKVYDYFKDGGIYQGPIGIVTYDNYMYLKRKYYNNKGSLWDLIFD